jgi:hypothetical protein
LKEVDETDSRKERKCKHLLLMKHCGENKKKDRKGRKEERVKKK